MDEIEDNPYGPTIRMLEKKLKVAPVEPKNFTHNGDGIYKFVLSDVGVSFELDRLRRDSHKLIGELCVRCTIPGARTYEGVMSVADFDLSSIRARSERAKLLAIRSGAEELDWVGYVEEFCQRVITTDRRGEPAIDLRTIEKPTQEDALVVEGMRLPKRHPAIIFGDGGAAKSYLGLFLASRMSDRGINVALFDWELAGEDHRDRLERLSGELMPKIYYARCERPLFYEADRLKRIVSEQKIDYAIYDSVAFACDGPPEAAEVAGRYFRAARQIGVGSLHIAHVTKGEAGDEKPFGSVFWNNGARSTWYVKAHEEARDTIALGLFNRKANLGPLDSPQGFRISFTPNRTFFVRSNPADTPDLADKMSIRQRLNYILRSGEMDLRFAAEQLDADPETIRRTVARHKRQFVTLDGGKIGLSDRHGR